VQEPVLIAHESKQKLRDAIQRVNRGKVDAIVQVAPTSPWPKSRDGRVLARQAVIAINTATTGTRCASTASGTRSTAGARYSPRTDSDGASAARPILDLALGTVQIALEQPPLSSSDTSRNPRRS